MTKRTLLFAMLTGLLWACERDSDIMLPPGETQGTIDADDQGALPGDIPSPAGNPLTASKVELGRALFWDPVMSGGLDVSCATCHHPAFGYTDGRDLPIGVGGSGLGPARRDRTNGDIPVVGRNSPTVINTAYNGLTANGNYDPAQAPMFWDNRTASLENQVLGPPTSFNEMRGHAYGEDVAIDSVVARLQAIPAYQRMFRDAFADEGITDQTMAMAIAAFERTIVAQNSPFDRFQAGDQNAMNAQAQRGLVAFNEVGCNNCHSGPMFSDYIPHTLGVQENNKLNAPDAGFNGEFAFRTPTLRNLRSTGPYFHNGTAGNLRDVMRHYVRAQNFARGGNGGGGNGGNNGINPNVNQVDPLLRDLRLNNNEIDDIVAFMDALNDESYDKRIPSSVPSGLPVGGNIQ